MSDDRDRAAQFMLDELAEEKRECRPDITVVVATVDTMFSSDEMAEYEFTKREQGPQRWSWVDRSGKVVTVAGADMPGSPDDGYPYFMITQPTVPGLGGYIMSTTFVIGREPQEIIAMLTRFWVNHWGAYAGLVAVASEIVATGTVAGGIAMARAITDLSNVQSRANDVCDAVNDVLGEVDMIIGKKPDPASN